MNTKTKSILAVLAMVVVLITAIPLSKSNAASPAITVGSINASVGETVTVEMKLIGDLSASMITETISFDPSKLEVVEVTTGSSLSGVSGAFVEVTDAVSANKAGEIVATMAGSGNVNIADGVLATIKFKVKEDVSGSQALSLTSEIYQEDATGETIDITDDVETTSGEINVVVPITGITLDKTSATLNVGENDSISATVEPSNTTEDTTVTWTTSDSSVATVEGGRVTAVAPGTATITATAGTKSATYTVTVVAPLNGIALNSTSENLLKGETTTLTVTYDPENTTDDKTVTWTSSDETVATVENGVVTAVAEGKTVITATVGNYSAACAINVTEKHLEDVELDVELNEDGQLELPFGTSKQLEVVFTPEDTTDSKDVTWKSSNEEVVKVDENGKITALKPGEATITAEVGEFEVTVDVIVPDIYIEDIEAKADKEKIEVGQTANIAVATNPEVVTEEVEITFTSSDETIATVDEHGVVKGLKPGKVTITVNVNGDFEKTVDIEVTEATVKETEEPKTEETKTEETKSVLPNTGDIAIVAFVALMIASVIGIALVIKKKITK